MNTNGTNKILIVDDDPTIRQFLSEALEKNGFYPVEAPDGRKAIDIFERERPDGILLDLIMPRIDGIRTMEELKRISPEIPVIIVTAHGDIPTAVDAMKHGAYDFVVKPINIERLILTLRRAIEKLELERMVKRLNTEVETSLEWLMGKSTIIKRVIRQVHQIAWSNLSLILQGETGTGKTLIASVIHNLSRRSEGPFVKVDISAIPETLVESELFGYEKGAFTGAEKRKKGFFEIAHGGTIFIDELQNMSPYVQSKLLSVLEDRRIYPLGATRPVDVDVRIITATNADVKEIIREKKFREDLFFRLGEFIITLPPLRERVEDIPFLAQRFLMEAGEELNKQMRVISDEALNLLMRYPWPGNVRELKNVLRRASILSDDGVIRPEHIEFLFGDKCEETASFPLLPLKELSSIAAKNAEKCAIKKALDMTKGNKSRAAAILQVDYKTLLTKIKEFDIRV